MRLLARREHSQSELLRKLSQKGFEAQLISQVVVQLQEAGYQSEQRYAAMWIKERTTKLYGPNKIKSELAQHRIDSDTVSGAVNELEIDWFELCERALVKKFGEDRDSDWSAMQKQKRYLWQRGFTEEQISCAIDDS